MFYFSVSNKSCDELLEQPRGLIWSPDEDGDGYYDFNLDCVWTVEVAENHVILFQVLYVDIQYAADCTFVDYLMVRIIEYTYRVLIKFEDIIQKYPECLKM